MFRKTSLPFARVGEDANAQVAQDARVSATVLKDHYVKDRDEELRQKSNRTYQRIVAGLPSVVARSFGYAEISASLEAQLATALSAKNRPLAAALTTQLAKQQHSATG